MKIVSVFLRCAARRAVGELWQIVASVAAIDQNSCQFDSGTQAGRDGRVAAACVKTQSDAGQGLARFVKEGGGLFLRCSGAVPVLAVLFLMMDMWVFVLITLVPGGAVVGLEAAVSAVWNAGGQAGNPTGIDGDGQRLGSHDRSGDTESSLPVATNGAFQRRCGQHWRAERRLRTLASRNNIDRPRQEEICGIVRRSRGCQERQNNRLYLKAAGGHHRWKSDLRPVCNKTDHRRCHPPQ